jgi:hypothetical protein
VLQGKFSQYFTPEDVARIQEMKLDFILRFAFGIIRGAILDTAKYGVWSFHHDDPDKYRGAPPGFWEIYYGDPVTGAILQRLTDRLDGGIVLHRGWFRTERTSYVANRDRALMGAASWPARVCKEILAGRLTQPMKPSPTKAPIYVAPNNWQTLVFLWRLLKARAEDKYRWFCKTEQWNVGVVTEPIQRLCHARIAPQAEWLPELPRHRYRADPFGIQGRDGAWVLVEDFNYTTRKGHISAIRLGSKAQDAGPVLRMPFHLSYPFLFNYAGSIYCVPEAWQSNGVAIYRASEFPTKWEVVADVLPGSSAVDPTVFHHNGLWWLFFTIHPESDTQLHAYWSRSPEGPWTAHLLNPLKTDVRSSRPAGTPFRDNGALIRPAQDCSEGYGTAVVLNRVLDLSPMVFQEEVIARILPNPRSRYRDGFHTVSRMGCCTLVDGKRFVFVPTVFASNMRATVRSLWRRLKR